MHGAVHVPLGPGSSSTLEGVFIPLADGEYAAPRLALIGVKMLWQPTLLTVQSPQAAQ